VYRGVRSEFFPGLLYPQTGVTVATAGSLDDVRVVASVEVVADGEDLLPWI
jgi:hypothetical protein